MINKQSGVMKEMDPSESSSFNDLRRDINQYGR